MKAYVFPGQGSQYSGMGKDLYENHAKAKEMFESANDILGFRITDIMFEGTEEELKQTKVTQPAIFLHSVITKEVLGEDFQPDMVAGHSLGEFSALVAAGALGFEDGLRLVKARAFAMQEACELEPSTMAAVLGLDDEVVEAVLKEIDDVVVPANYNTVGQLVISGSMKGVETAMEKLLKAGARRVVPLNVGGAFHSPLMAPAGEKLKAAIEAVNISTPFVPVYQNVDALPNTDPVKIKQNLIKQLTAPVRWTQTVKNMIDNGATEFIETGPGKVLQSLIKKVDRKMPVRSAL